MVNRHIRRERKRIPSLDSQCLSRSPGCTACVASQIVAGEIGDGGIVVCVGADVAIHGVLDFVVREGLEYVCCEKKGVSWEVEGEGRKE